MDNATQQNEIIEQLRDKIHVKDQRIEQLENLLKQARQQHFGTSSEKLSPDQIALFNEPEAEVNDAEDTESQKIKVPSHTCSKTKKRVSIPDELPREDIIYDLSDADKICPHDVRH